MNHATDMSGMDSPRQGLDELCRRAHRLGRTVEVLSQTAARHELKSKVGPPVSLADIVNLNDVRMLQASERRGLVPKPDQVLCTGLKYGKDHFQCYGAIESKLPSPVNDTHPTAAENPQDFVSGNLRHGLRTGVRLMCQRVIGTDRNPRDLLCQFGAMLGKALLIFSESKARFLATTKIILGGDQPHQNSLVASQFRVLSQIFFDSCCLPCFKAQFQINMHKLDEHSGAKRIVDLQHVVDPRSGSLAPSILKTSNSILHGRPIFG